MKIGVLEWINVTERQKNREAAAVGNAPDRAKDAVTGGIRRTVREQR
ncbi:hypothetical protein TERTU_3574 [Teredinibacter turnerae T7901]|uniref:Uncharacterized protein n=1 Tax=Teredinibacter turnerae (strain ATCC 39867 / T7901) TaxID=377629 RepID=C5BRJ2_TERTT|nr:hypothetical protein TERTU_3574 [Teredinibacter turnerae T7901]